MEDLLREEEFLQQKTFNPWKRFIVFYCIASIQIPIAFLLSKKIDYVIASMLIFLLFILLLAMPFVMISKKYLERINPKTMLSGILILMVVYFLSSVIIDIIINGIYFYSTLFHLKTAVIIFSGFIAYGSFSYGCIRLIIRYRKKKLSRTS